MPSQCEMVKLSFENFGHLKLERVPQKQDYLIKVGPIYATYRVGHNIHSHYTSSMYYINAIL